MNIQYWEREELYEEVWESSLSKLAEKYGISNVAIGKICRKLKIPLPGRGYWAKKAAGYTVRRRPPLPEFKNPPMIRRAQVTTTPKPKIDSSDPELVKIAEIESSLIPITTEEHTYISKARNILLRSRKDDYGRTNSPLNIKCLDIRVSKELLERALNVMNAIIYYFGRNALPLNVADDSTSVEVLGQIVKFGIEEELQVKERREEKNYIGIRNIVIYELSGNLAFRVWNGANNERKRWGDGKFRKLESLIPKCIGGLFRNARLMRAESERIRLLHLEWERRRLEDEERVRKAQEEQKKLHNFVECADNWHKAKRLRVFIAAVEETCKVKGESTAPDSPRGKWLKWARQKANWIDPLVDEKENAVGDSHD